MKLNFSDKDNIFLLQNDFFISNYLALAHRELEFYFNNFADIKNSLGISRIEGLYLILINYNSGISQSRIAEILHTDITLVSKLTKSLLLKGLIEKMFDDNDKRKSVISLSEKGKLIVPQFLDFYSEFNNIFFKGFSKSEKKKLEVFLIKIFNNTQFFKTKI